MKKKFIRFTLELPERDEEYAMSEDVQRRLEYDHDNQRGIYLFGYVDIRLTENKTLAVCGKYVAPTITECKQRLKLLKAKIRQTFDTKKVSEFVVVQGSQF